MVKIAYDLRMMSILAKKSCITWVLYKHEWSWVHISWMWLESQLLTLYNAANAREVLNYDLSLSSIKNIRELN